MSLNLTSKRVIFDLCRKYKVRPSKKLGQNFLIDISAIKKFLKAAQLSPQDTVLEIGPGIGNLTQEIAKKAKKVIAVEKDPKMITVLKEVLKNYQNVKIIQEDILKIDLRPYILNLKPYKVVANLPFYLTTPVIRQFLELNKVKPRSPRSMTLIVQKEVAQRIVAQPSKMNLLAVSVQFYAKPEITDYISKKSFWPRPKVDSAIIRIDPQINTDKKTDSRSFFQVVRAGFSQPRKMLINNLTKKLKIEKEKIKEILRKNNINHSQRPETLTIRDWQNLTRDFSPLLLL